MADYRENVVSSILPNCLQSDKSSELLCSLLPALSDHAIFGLKKANVLQDLVAEINSCLNSSRTRLQGLAMLEHIIAQCSPELFSNSCQTWIQLTLQALRSHGSSQQHICTLRVLSKILEQVKAFPELARDVGTNKIKVLLPTILAMPSMLTKEAVVSCIITCILCFPGPTSVFKTKIQTLLAEELDTAFPSRVYICCYALLAQCTTGGHRGEKHRECWTVQYNNLMSALNSYLTHLYANLETGEETGEDTIFTLPLPDTQPERMLCLVRRFSTLSGCLTALLGKAFPTWVQLRLEEMLHFICRTLAVQMDLLVNKLSADQLLLLINLPSIHSSILDILSQLIVCTKKLLVADGELIHRLCIQCLASTNLERAAAVSCKPFRPEGRKAKGFSRKRGADMDEVDELKKKKRRTEESLHALQQSADEYAAKQMPGEISEKLFFARKLREKVYHTLELWFKVAGSSSGLTGESGESSLQDLMTELFSDISPQQAESLQLDVGSKTNNIPPVKKKKKKSKNNNYQELSVSTHSWHAGHNERTAIVALKVMHQLIVSSGPVMPDAIVMELQVKVCDLVRRIQQSPSSPYSSSLHCRQLLYQALLAAACVPKPNILCLQQAISLFQLGTLDTDFMVAASCREALVRCQSLVHPIVPCLRAPVILPALNQPSLSCCTALTYNTATIPSQNSKESFIHRLDEQFYQSTSPSKSSSISTYRLPGESQQSCVAPKSDADKDANPTTSQNHSTALPTDLIANATPSSSRSAEKTVVLSSVKRKRSKSEDSVSDSESDKGAGVDIENGEMMEEINPDSSERTETEDANKEHRADCSGAAEDTCQEGGQHSEGTKQDAGLSAMLLTFDPCEPETDISDISDSE